LNLKGAAVDDSDNRQADRQTSARDSKIEGFIDTLHALADDAEEAQMPAFAQILDEAFKRCLLQYLSEKKAALDMDLSTQSHAPETLN
jgi:hypothetical protein